MRRTRVVVVVCVATCLVAIGGFGAPSDAHSHSGGSGTGATQKSSVPAPTGVTATAGNASATVTWTAPPTNQRHPITGYIVTPVVGGIVQTTASVTTTSMTQVMTGLTNGTTYTFGVESLNGTATSTPAYSNAVIPAAPAAPPPPPAPVLSLPSSIPADCSADVTAALNGFFAGVPAGSTVALNPGGCYRVDGILTISGRQGVTVSAAGARLERTTYVGGWEPVVQLYENTNLTIAGLTIDGAFASGRAMLSDEGDYGMVLAGNHGVSLSGITIDGVAGDFISLFPPGQHGDDPADQSLNYDISVTGSTFMNAGYHGVTIESAERASFANDSFTNVGLDGIDLEYDTYGTVFAPDGTPEVAAEIDVSFDHTTWTNVNQEWFVSWQGAVVERNISLTNNTLHGFGAWIDVGSLTPNTLYDGFTVANNSSDTMLQGAADNLPIDLTYVHDVTVTGNSFPVGNKPAAQVYGVANVRVAGNSFEDATTPVAVDPVSSYSGQPWTGTPSLNVTDCGNGFGPQLSLTDGPC